ncbi:DUF3383 family protein [Cupriavidus sp. D384]|uniref:DUF3383 family protein n=1 Tax=Cupriavidus sp. D384 TaxID=1538095 RepID=UPI00083671E9|nr:DUF3383 family protein [Cupriavidus sp. D384]
MANIDRIVNVQISLNTTAIKEQSFSDLLVLGPHAAALPRVMAVTEADQLLDLGISERSPVYKAVRDVFKQIPTLSRCFIGRQHVDEVSVTIREAREASYSITLHWFVAREEQWIETVAVEGKAGDTPEAIAQALAAAVTATKAPLTAVTVGPELSIVAKVEGTPFVVQVSRNMTIAEPASRELVTWALSECKREADSWYGICIASRAEADILAAAEWAESNGKLFGAALASRGTLDASTYEDLASRLAAKQYFRTHIWYHARAAEEWLEAAVSANRFTFYPGSETWADVKLAGITTDNLTEGESSGAQFKNVNTFEPFRNFAITQGGKVASGEWIDVIRFRDWLAEAIKVNVMSALVNLRNRQGKVPFTDSGIEVITTAMRQALDLGVTRGGIAPAEVDEDGRTIPSYTIVAPRAASVPFNDKASRMLYDVGFTARLAGAIHAVNIKGNLTYSL